MGSCIWKKPTLSYEDHMAWRLKMLKFWKDRHEERLAGLSASIEKLEEHINRDNKKDPPEVESFAAEESSGSSQ